MNHTPDHDLQRLRSDERRRMDERRGHLRGNYPDDRDHGYGHGYDPGSNRDYRRPGDYGYDQRPSGTGASGS